MNQKQQQQLSATCQCGKVEFEAGGAPILTGICYCTSCQQAGRQFEQLPAAPPLLDPDVERAWSSIARIGYNA
jgi:hypothetical protein